jgi:hypothetical protein
MTSEAAEAQGVQEAGAAPPVARPKERARRFHSRMDAEAARSPRLHADNPVPLEQFADLVGDYKFPRSEYVRCQLVDQEGRCHRWHGWGYIAQLKDGTEGYIGHDCAEGHFKADPRFAAMFAAASARVDREITTDLLVARLSELLADVELPITLKAARRRQQRLSILRREHSKAFPDRWQPRLTGIVARQMPW